MSVMGSPPISDYAIIGDCRTAALVSRGGSIDWLCLPDFSSPSVFAALLDGDRGGRFSIRPTQACQITRRYVSDTNVLETEFCLDVGTVRVTDLLPVLADEEWKNTLEPAREVLRIVECLRGTVEVEIRFEPRPNYGRIKQRLRRYGSSVWRLEFRDELVLLHTDVPLAPRGKCAAHGVVRLTCGETRYLSLTYSKSDIAVLPMLGEYTERRRTATIQWWRRWSARCTYEGPYRDYVVRSVLVLKLLTFALSGAVIAAPTTSLPEELGGSLNWDYRYCWLRDAEFTLTAFTDLGFGAEAQAYLTWLLHSTRLSWPRLQVLYDVYGETRLPEQALAHFAGYRNSSPVRIGNDAYRQVQLDVYGAVIGAAYEYVNRGGALDRAERKLLVGFGREVCHSWGHPDHSIWEVRGGKRHYTYSKLLCWVALDRLLKLHDAGILQVPVRNFCRTRDEIRHAIENRAFSADHDTYTGVFDTNALDASLLRMSALGYAFARDSRVRSTFGRLTAALGTGALMYRYDESFDNGSGREGAFGACSFWAVEHLALAGQRKEAQRRFETLLRYGGELGLFAEEIDPDSGAALGNFPQALTHASLISAAVRLSHAQPQAD